MFSCKFYEKWMSIRKGIKSCYLKLSHTQLQQKQSHHNYNRNSHVHIAPQKIKWRKMWSFQKCGEKTIMYCIKVAHNLC